MADNDKSMASTALALRFTGKKGGDDALVLALAAGQSVNEAAKQAKVGQRTVYRRLEDPAFRAKIDAVRSDLMGRVIGQLADAATEAIALLRKQLGSQSEMVAQRAAELITDFAFKGHEVADLKRQQQAILDRLDAMEASRARRVG